MLFLSLHTNPLNPGNPVKSNTMEFEELTHKIIGCAYKVFNQLGFGFLESVYKKAMIIELMKDSVKVEVEKQLTVYYDNQIVGDFYVDLFIENEIIVELKSVKNLSKEHACPVECFSDPIQLGRSN